MRIALAFLLAGACGSSPALPPATAPGGDGMVVVRLRFEPALAVPGRLIAMHESGVRVEVETGRAGVELWLPPGPASLQLVVGRRRIERPLLVRGSAEVVFPTSPR